MRKSMFCAVLMGLVSTLSPLAATSPVMVQTGKPVIWSCQNRECPTHGVMKSSVLLEGTSVTAAWDCRGRPCTDSRLPTESLS